MSDAPATHTFSNRLSAFFPPDDPESKWLFRLAIIRDDLAFEIGALPLTPDSTSEDVWRTSYFVRRICVTLAEARSIFEYEVGRLSSDPSDAILENVSKHLVQTIKFLNSNRSVIDSIRNSVGAHIRPGKAANDVDVIQKVLTTYPELKGKVEINFEDRELSSYRGLTLNAILFAWPQLDTDADHERAQRELATAILRGAGMAIDAIDVLLVRHWWRHGIIRDTESGQLAIFQEKAAALVAVGKPPISIP